METKELISTVRNDVSQEAYEQKEILELCDQAETLLNKQSEGNVRSYVVTFEEEDSIIVNVVDDVNRPNNDDCETILQRWIHDNYGYREYEYHELSTLEVVNL
jgi:hypothetical protein